jgi:hypothetical protein
VQKKQQNVYDHCNLLSEAIELDILTSLQLDTKLVSLGHTSPAQARNLIFWHLDFLATPYLPPVKPYWINPQLPWILFQLHTRHTHTQTQYYDI